MTEKMTGLDVEETSGVDRPAHLDDGFIIIKQAEANVPEETPEQQPSPEEQAARIKELEEQLAGLEEFKPEPAEAPVEELVKAAPEAVTKAFDEMRERVEKAEALLAKAEDERLTREASEFAKSLKSITVEASLIKELRATPVADKVEALLKSVDGQLESAGMFKELGSTGTESSATDRLDSLAKALMESDPNLTIQQARTNVVLANPEIYNEMRG